MNDDALADLAIMRLQRAYADIGTRKAWPEFAPADLASAINEFRHRERRFGGLGDKRPMVALVAAGGEGR